MCEWLGQGGRSRAQGREVGEAARQACAQPRMLEKKMNQAHAVEEGGGRRERTARTPGPRCKHSALPDTIYCVCRCWSAVLPAPLALALVTRMPTQTNHRITHAGRSVALGCAEHSAQVLHSPSCNHLPDTRALLCSANIAL